MNPKPYATVNRLVTENIRLAYFWAKKMEWRWGPDSLSIAQAGLLKGAQIYDPSLGCPFGTFASVAIKYEFNRTLQKTRCQKRGPGISHVPLDAPLYFEGAMTVAEHVADENALPPDAEYAAVDRVAEARRFLALLPARSQQILALRYGMNGNAVHTLEEIAARYGLTRERIRQIQDNALRLIWRKQRYFKAA